MIIKYTVAVTLTFFWLSMYVWSSMQTHRYADVLGVPPITDGALWWFVLPYVLACRAFVFVTSIPVLGRAFCANNCKAAGIRLRRGVGSPVNFEFKHFEQWYVLLIVCLFVLFLISSGHRLAHPHTHTLRSRSCN